jgi:hypothetical protein
MSDTELLNWLENNAQGYALVSDDNKHWACVCDGIQNIPENWPGNIHTSFFIGQEQWKPSIREAIISAIQEREEE